MEKPGHSLARRRAAHRPQWSGLTPEALFSRLAAEPVPGDALCALGDALLGTADGRMLEFVALRTSAARGCVYMWRGHCQIALRRPGAELAPDEIARVAVGPAAFDGADASILRAIDELLADRVLSPATRREIGDTELILAIATLFYETVAVLMHDAAPEAEPVRGLETPADAIRTLLP